MAKFGCYFGLCPLIDHRSLLGIAKDAKNGQVLVTLGRNIAIQYRLSDQKQILSWTTKEKFSSPVVYDFKLNKYVAVFNQTYIRCWECKNLNVDKVKKLRFNANIHTLTVIDNTTFVIFQNGYVIELEEALADHKALEPTKFLEENEHIIDVTSCQSQTSKYIGLLIGDSKTGEVLKLLWTTFNTEGNRTNDGCLNLKKHSCELVANVFHISSNEVELLTLWSDGKLYVKSIENTSDGHGQLFSVIESISFNDPVSMVSLDKNYIAIYGANVNQEGALVIMYNMQFKVTQCRQAFKFLKIGAKLWPVEDNLFLPIGQNLAVIPYHLEQEQLSALVGSHKINLKENGNDVVILQNIDKISWTKKKTDQTNIVMNENEMAKEYLDMGCSELTIFQEVVPNYLKNTNIQDLTLLLKVFDDIPEKYFIEALKYILEAPAKLFKNQELHSDDSYPENLQPFQRYKILEIILNKPINEVALIPYLRMNLDLNNTLDLLKFITFLLSDNSNKPNICFINNLISWICLILDANYQTFLLNKDKNVIELLLSLGEFVSSEILCLDDLQKLCVVMKHMAKPKKVGKFVESNYSVERIDLL